MSATSILLREAAKALELRRLKRRRGTGLKRAAHQELRRQQRSEIHVIARLRRLQVVAVEASLRHLSRSIDRHVVRALWVTIGIATN